MVTSNIFAKRLQTSFTRSRKILERAKNSWSAVTRMLKESGLSTQDLALCGWPIRLVVARRVESEHTRTPSSVLTGLMLRILYDALEKDIESALVEDGKLVEPKLMLKEAADMGYKKWLALMFPHVAPEYYQFIVDQHR